MQNTDVSTAEKLYSAIRTKLGDDFVAERRFTLAGNSIALQASSKELLARLGEAFSHLRPADSEPDLTIRVGVAELPAPETIPGGQTVGGHRFWTSPDRRYFCHVILSSGSWYCVDRAAGMLIGAVSSVEQMSTFERAKPVVRPLQLWLEQRGLIPVHAGMVSWRDRGILIGGRGGSGKSTTSLASLQGGLDLLAEDYTLLEETADARGRFIGHSLYSSAWVERDHLWRFRGLTAKAIPGDEMANGKSILQLREGYQQHLISAAPVHYLVLPRIRPDGVTALHQASRAEGVKRFALESMVTLTRLGALEFQRLSALVHGVDCYWLDLGVDLDRVPKLLKELVERRPDV